MAPSIHLLAAFSGGWKSAPNALETWQFGLRFRCSNTAPDSVGTIPTDYVPTAININRTETLWTITGNWRLGGPAGSNLNVDDWLNDQLAPAVTTMINTTGMSNELEVREVRVYPIRSPDGRSEPAPPYSSGTPVVLTWTSSKPTGPSIGTLPLQDSLVCSLRTGNPGRKGRGRFYLPGIAPVVLDSPAGVLDPTYQGGLATAYQTFIQSCCIRLTAPNSLFVSPIVTGSPYDTYGLVSSIQVDDLVDTQRRRRKKLIPTVMSRVITLP